MARPMRPRPRYPNQTAPPGGASSRWKEVVNIPKDLVTLGADWRSTTGGGLVATAAAETGSFSHKAGQSSVSPAARLVERNYGSLSRAGIAIAFKAYSRQPPPRFARRTNFGKKLLSSTDGPHTQARGDSAPWRPRTLSMASVGVFDVGLIRLPSASSSEPYVVVESPSSQQVSLPSQALCRTRYPRTSQPSLSNPCLHTY